MPELDEIDLERLGQQKQHRQQHLQHDLSVKCHSADPGLFPSSENGSVRRKGPRVQDLEIAIEAFEDSRS